MFLFGKAVDLTPMKTTRVAWLVAATVFLSPLFAQNVTNPQGVTTLTLSSYDIRLINNPVPAGRVRVPPSERVTLQAPPLTGPLQWWKNNQAVPGATGTTFVLPLTTPADSAFYNVVDNSSSTMAATGVQLDVVLPGHLGNFSSLVAISGAGAQTLGFNVSGGDSKTLLIRAVGPSLAAFGVPNSVSSPRFRVFDSSGKEYIVARPAIVTDWPKVFAAAGAFTLAQAGDAYDWYALPPGAYTIQATDAKGQGGMLLLEAYEFPVSALSGATVVSP